MVKGKTAEERAVERAAKKRRERREYFADEAKKDSRGRAKVQQACRFAYAVCENELDEQGRAELARQIAATVHRVADEVAERMATTGRGDGK